MKSEEILKTAKPILFNTEMVRAIQGGRKTVTRRPVKSKSPKACGFYVTFDSNGNFEDVYDYDEDEAMFESPQARLHIGDILYVRETWCKGSLNYGEEQYFYKADGIIPHCTWNPSIHMPKEAARIFLRVTDVRVERLRPMGLDELEAEGINILKGLFASTVDFADLWDSTVKKSELEIYGWDANPWVWVIGFEKVEVTK